MSTHSPAEWAAFTSLGISAWAVMAALLWLTVDAEPADFDPRPAARRATTALHQGVVHAGHDWNRARAHAERAAVLAAITTAAALALLLPAQGGSR